MVAVSERSAVRRLYDRFGFGAAPGDLDQSFDTALDRLLTAAPGGDAPAPPELPGTQARRERTEAQKALAAWWLDRMVAVDVATTERLTWFWHGHFATSAQKVREPALMLTQNDTFRGLALGASPTSRTR